MPKLKLITACLGFLLYFVVFSFVCFNSIFWQSMGFGASLILAWFRLGSKGLVYQLKLLLPFVSLLIVIYAVFILIGVRPEGESAFEYWVGYGSTRTLLLVSTILIFRVFLSLINFNDLLRLNLSIHLLKYVLLGRILFRSSFQTHASICFWLSMIPTEQSSGRSFKHRFKVKLSTALAMTMFILAEAEQKGLMIDNRIQCCHKEIV
ncbi:MAG TPA: hypothetical protein PL188_00355 [Candidatus Cloacimonadota bacterium]|nr:hypothetical protein [Candidatus Cloacimonadota bacterium]